MNNHVQDAIDQVVGCNWPETKKSDAEIQDMLVKARVSMLIKAPFFGSLATRLKFIDATAWCPTLATDGRNFYYNKHFVTALAERDGELEFGIGHEVLHCVYDHLDKTTIGNRDRQLANIAQDYVINAELIDAHIGKKIELVPICFDHQYRGKHWLEVYDLLQEQANEQESKTFDVHLDSGDSNDQQSNTLDAPGEGDNDGTQGPIKYGTQEKQQISQEIQNAVLQSAKISSASNLPGGVKRLVHQLVNPQLDWRELLPVKIQSVIRSDYSWMRPSRKGLDAGLYLPGLDRDQTIDVVIGMDTSGSMTTEMSTDILSEVKGCMEQFTEFKLHIFCYDTQVHNPQTFTENNTEDLLEYEIKGGGGTNFDCCYDYMKENNINPALFVNFTDGYPWNSWGDETYCDTLFIVHSSRDGNSPTAPFGITVQYERN